MSQLVQEILNAQISMGTAAAVFAGLMCVIFGLESFRDLRIQKQIDSRRIT